MPIPFSMTRILTLLALLHFTPQLVEAQNIVRYKGLAFESPNELDVPDSNRDEVAIDLGNGMVVTLTYIPQAANTFQAFDIYYRKHTGLTFKTYPLMGMTYDEIVAAGKIDSLVKWNTQWYIQSPSSRIGQTFIACLRGKWDKFYGFSIEYEGGKEQRKLAKKILKTARKNDLNRAEMDAYSARAKTIELTANYDSVDNLNEVEKITRKADAGLLTFVSDPFIVPDSTTSRSISWGNFTMEIPSDATVKLDADTLTMVYGMFFNLQLWKVQESVLLDFRDRTYPDEKTSSMLSYGDQLRKSSWSAFCLLSQESDRATLDPVTNWAHGYHQTFPWQTIGGTGTAIETEVKGWEVDSVRFKRFLVGWSDVNNQSPTNYHARLNLIHPYARKIAMRVLTSLKFNSTGENMQWGDFVDRVKQERRDGQHLSGLANVRKIEQIDQWSMLAGTGFSRISNEPRTYTSLLLGIDFDDAKARELATYEERKQFAQSVFNSKFGKTFIKRSATREMEAERVYEQYKRSIELWPIDTYDRYKTDLLDYFFNTYSRGVIRMNQEFKVIPDNRRMPLLFKDYASRRKTGDRFRPWNTSLISDVEKLFPEVKIGDYDILNLLVNANSSMKRPHAMSDVNRNGEILNLIALNTDYGTTTVIHEYLHLFGLMDLYWEPENDPLPDYPALSKIEGTNFDIMGSGNDAISLLGFHQYFLGWLSAQHVEIIDQNWEGTLNPVLADDGTAMLMYVSQQPGENQPIIYCIEMSNSRKYKNGIIVYRVLPHTGTGMYPVVFGRKPGSTVPNIYYPGESFGPLDQLEHSGPGWRDDKDQVKVEVLEEIGDSYKIRVQILE